VVIRVLMFPLRPITWLGSWFLKALGVVFGPALRRIDASPWLSERIDSLSSAMATQRGLPILIGTGLLIASFLAHGVVILLLVAYGSLSDSVYWLCIPFALLHIGLLTGFIGIMVATPLGQGYKDK